MVNTKATKMILTLVKSSSALQ